MSEYGWGSLANSRKWHFIVTDESDRQKTLCGKVVLFRTHNAPPLENDADNHEDNCRACRRKVAAWRQKTGNEADHD